MAFGRKKRSRKQPSGRNRLLPKLLPEYCLLSQGRQCRACEDICPSGALRTGESLTLTAAKCLGCGLCDATCPAHAIQHPVLRRALNGLTELPETKELALTCHGCLYVPVAKERLAVLPVSGCLSALGPEAFVLFAAKSVHKIYVPVQECSRCVRGDGGAALHQALAIVRTMCTLPIELELIPYPSVVAGDTSRVEQEPAVNHSRRAFFRSLTPERTRRKGGTPSACQHRTVDEQVIQKRPATAKDIFAFGKKGRRNIFRAALGMLKATPETHCIPEMPFSVGDLTVQRSCIACGACARSCPSGALAFVQHAATFRLEFSPWLCRACGICVESCLPHCLHLEQASTRQLLKHRHVLAEGTLTRCARCGASMPDTGEKHCLLCARRLQSFG